MRWPSHVPGPPDWSCWPIVANSIGIEQFPVKPGSATHPVPGYDVHVLDEEGHDLPRGKNGAIAIQQLVTSGLDISIPEQSFTLENGNFITQKPATPAVANKGGPPEYVEKNWERLVAAAQTLQDLAAEQAAAAPAKK